MTISALDRIGLKLARDKEKQAPPPPVNSDLGAALAEVIRQAAQAGAEAAVEKQVKPVNPAIPVHRRPFTDKAEQHTFPAGPPQAKSVKDLTISTQRDELKRLKFITIGNDVRFEIQRDGEGRVVRMVQLD